MGAIRKHASHKRWTEEEVRALAEHYPASSHVDILTIIPGRSMRIIQCKANSLGLVRHKPPKMTPDEVRIAKRNHMARRRAADPDGSRKYHREQHHKNHEANKKRLRQYAAKRFFWAKAMKLRGEGKATYKDLASLWRQQRGICALSGRRLDRSAQLDHKLPKARGGDDTIENLQWLCKEANLAKRDLTDAEFKDLCGDVMRWIGERIQQVDIFGGAS